MPSSRGSFHPGIKHRSPALQAESLPAELPEKPCFTHRTTYTVVKCIFVPQIVERSVQRHILKASSGSIFKALKVCEACRYFVGFLFFLTFFCVELVGIYWSCFDVRYQAVLDLNRALESIAS